MPQTLCPYYYVHPNKTTSPKVGYCEHKHSPLRRWDALSAKQDPLTCGGDLSKCQVPIKWRLDM